MQLCAGYASRASVLRGQDISLPLVCPAFERFPAFFVMRDLSNRLAEVGFKMDIAALLEIFTVLTRYDVNGCVNICKSTNKNRESDIGTPESETY
jgi:hypothetical protein